MTQPHTPAPWHAEQNEDRLVIRSDGGTEICEVTGETFDEYAEEEREANAALIAAAPELFDALKAITDLIDVYSIDKPWRDARAAALRAIAKATGA